MKYAVIEGARVVNLILWDGDDEFALPEGQSLVVVPEGEQVGPGFSYEEGAFVAPPEPEVPPAAIPVSVTIRQAQRALLAADLLDQVEAAIDAMPSPQREEALIDWNKATTVERSSPLVQVLAQTLGLDEAALDALFVAASEIV